eukprot:GHRR01025445.1.p1 GENE.GHRR01025445.1~~GHRR01025445.1.p1  ORF type:complete len:195 (+),score=46.36 GHRR01025445.1:342-926(+)
MRSSSLLGRARRLTDTSSEGTVSKTEHLLGRQPSSGIGASPTSKPAGGVCNVINCKGGGLEQSKTVNVGAFKLTYSVHTQAGADPGGNTKDNQDAWCVQEQLAGQDMVLFGVFDGHGQEGKIVSHTICQNLPKILSTLGQCKVCSATTWGLSVSCLCQYLPLCSACKPCKAAGAEHHSHEATFNGNLHNPGYFP